MRVLLWLDIRQIINMAKFTLRSPKRLIPIAMFAAYIALLYFQRLMFRFSHTDRIHVEHYRGFAAIFTPDRVWAICFTLMVGYGLYYIYKSFGESPLVYGMAEVDFIFPAPIKRRIVGSYKLFKSYLKLGLIVLLMAYVMLPQFELMSGSPRAYLIMPVWLAVVLYGMLIINIAVSVNLAFGERSGRGERMRRWFRFTALALLVLLTLAIGRVYLQTGDFVAAAVAVVRNPVLSILLAPSAWASDVVTSQFTGASGGMRTRTLELAVLALASFIVVAARVKYSYEASLEVSMRRAARRAALKEGGLKAFRFRAGRAKKVEKPSLFITPFGRGAGAMLWKNILITARNLGRVSILLVFGLPALGLLARPYVHGRLDPEAVSIMGTVMLFNIIWVTTMFMLHELRGNLKQVDMLKPMPIPGWKLIAAETVPGAAVVAGVIWLLVISAGIAFGPPRSDLLLLALVALPVVCYDAVCSLVTPAILYPDWTDQTQLWIGTLLSGLLTTIAVGPPAAVGAILYALHVTPLVTIPLVIMIAGAFAMAGILLGAYVWTRRDPVFD